MGIEKLGIRWGRGQKRKRRREDDLAKANTKIRYLEADVDALQEDIRRLRMMVEELADASDVYLPTFTGRSFN